MSNAKEISDKLNNLFEPGGEGHKAICEALEKACMGVIKGAKERCPVDTGDLRNSIVHDIDEKNTTGYVGTSVPYAPYVEIGTGIYSSKGDGRQTPWVYVDPKTGEKVFTRGSHPHPFLKPALEENKDAIVECFEEIL